VNITVLCVGSVKEKYLVDGIKEYQKRLGNYCNLSILEVKDEKTRENLSPKEAAIIQDREGERLLSRIRPSQYMITLEIEGEQISSEAFARQLEGFPHQGVADIVW